MYIQMHIHCANTPPSNAQETLSLRHTQSKLQPLNPKQTPVNFKHKPNKPSSTPPKQTLSTSANLDHTLNTKPPTKPVRKRRAPGARPKLSHLKALWKKPQIDTVRSKIELAGRLVVSNMFLFSIIYGIYNPSHWLIFFKMVKTTNQFVTLLKSIIACPILINIDDKHPHKHRCLFCRVASWNRFCSALNLVFIRYDIYIYIWLRIKAPGPHTIHTPRSIPWSIPYHTAWSIPLVHTPFPLKKDWCWP